MSEQVFDEVDDFDLPDDPATVAPPPNGEVVHWMEPKPMRVGPAGISATAATGFVLGAAAAVGVLLAFHLLGPEREAVQVVPPRWRSRIRV